MGRGSSRVLGRSEGRDPAARLGSDPFLKRRLGRAPWALPGKGCLLPSGKHPLSTRVTPAGQGAQQVSGTPLSPGPLVRLEKPGTMQPVRRCPPTDSSTPSPASGRTLTEGEPSGLGKEGVTPVSWRGAHPDSHASAPEAHRALAQSCPLRTLGSSGQRCEWGAGSATGGHPGEQRGEGVSRVFPLSSLHNQPYTHACVHAEQPPPPQC